MTGTIADLALAAAFLLATHFGISSTGLRPALVDRVGEQAYRGLYSLLAAAALAWLVLAWRDAPYLPLWDHAPWQNWVPVAVMPLALMLVVGGLTVRNPSAVGQEKALTAAEPAQGLLRVTRNPFLWGVGLWALAHMVPNGDAAGLLFFGALAALALVGTVLIDAKNRARRGLDWERFEQATGNIPLAAVLQGRQSLARAAAEFGTWRLLVTVALYGALLHLHGWIVGVGAIPAG
ncbi:MAG TPA: NnrU family protein [Azospirillaceae bacterium]|nr:NnrU family protein [Azospirillaceae bacterium]